MKNKQKIATAFLQATGLHQLQPSLRVFILIHFLFMAVYYFQTVFLNTLFMRLFENIQSVFVYNTIFYASVALGAIPASIITKRWSAIICLQLGLCACLSVCGLCFAVMPFIDRLMPLVALLVGVSNAAYFMAYFVCIAEYSDGDSLDAACAIPELAAGIMMLTVPAICGWVISFMGSTQGYLSLFVAGFFILLLALFVSTKLPPIRPENPKVRLLAAVRNCATEPLQRKALALMLIVSIREGVFAFLFNVLLFQIVAQEAVIGFSSFLAGMAVVVTSWLYGKYATQRLRNPIVKVTVWFMLCSVLLMAFTMNRYTLIYFHIINAVGTALVLTPLTAISVSAFDTKPQDQSMRTELLTVKEFCIFAGRLLGIGIALAFVRTNHGYLAAILAICLLQLLLLPVLKSATNPL